MKPGRVCKPVGPRRASHPFARLVVVLLLAGGCASAFSKEIRHQVDPAAAFKAVLQNPDSFKGKTVLWGGEIIETRNTPDAAWIELLQHPLSGDDRPIRGPVSEGRFLIRHEGFLDPAVYGRGREVTVAGEVRGGLVRPLDEIEYRYPIVADKELVLWGPRREPAFHFGLGLGATFSK